VTPVRPGGETPLDEILVLSDAMLGCAREQDWAGVANLEVTRDALLKTVFEGTERPSPEALTAVVRQVLESDRELIALGEQARGEFAAALGQMRQGLRAQAAYSDSNGE
jgi:hypothetical protein